MTKKFFDKVIRYAKSPEMLRAWVLIFVIALLAIMNAIFAPAIISIFTVIGAFFIILGIIVTVLRFLDALQGLRFRNNEFQSLIESLHEAVITYDVNFRVLQINKAAEEIFQLNSQEIIGRTIEPGLLNNPRYRTVIQLLYPSLAPVVTQISEAGAWPQTVNLALEDPYREFKTTLHRVMDEKGNHIGFLKLIKDVTREKAILQSKSEFINTAAHQLRTPLTAINWSLETLAKNVENQDQITKDLVAETRKLSERTLKIANDLLDASKIEEGRFGYAFADIDLIQVIKDVVESVLPLAKLYKVGIYFDPQGINSLFVYADRNRLGIAIANLLDNAIRYNIKDGKVIIALQKLEKKPFVKIAVTDSGIGVSEGDAPKIFGKFFRGANAIQVESNGNGLGLYITKNIVKRHGGEIGIESIINRGSTFWFTIPTDPKLIPAKEVDYEETL